jgi:hypothetical protein
MVEALACVLTAMAIGITVIYVCSRVGSAIHEGIEAARERRQLYEFAENFVCEVHSASEIKITDAGRGVKIVSDISGSAVSYGMADGCFTALGAQLFQVNDVWFMKSERLVFVVLDLGRGGEFMINGFRRVGGE